MSEGDNVQAKRIVVIGAGIAGVSAALYLQRDGHQVTVLDPRDPGTAASFGNAGVIARYGCVPTATPDMLARVPKLLMNPYGPLAIRWSYLPRLAPWLLQLIRNAAPQRILANARSKSALLDLAWDAYLVLIEEAGAGDLIHHGGMIRVYETDEGFRRAQREIDLMRQCGRKVDILTADEIRDLEPALAPIFRHGLYFSDSHNIRNPGRLVEMFSRRFTTGQGAVVKQAVTGLARNAEGDWRVATDGEGFEADAIVVAAGAWSARIAKMIGVRVLLDTERGYHVMLPHPDETLGRSVHFAEPTCMITPMEGGLRLTTGVELAGVDAPPDYTRVRRMIPIAKRLIPGLKGEIQTEWMGWRPSMPDTV
ncbi:MAG: FAD-dependent oxidoreductase, partial [Alphaproteobacteria bacterium]|nr:FAD-dependent oxidoreductase [Alphaproteobacteria bacterium]